MFETIFTSILEIFPSYNTLINIMRTLQKNVRYVVPLSIKSKKSPCVSSSSQGANPGSPFHPAFQSRIHLRSHPLHFPHKFQWHTLFVNAFWLHMRFSSKRSCRHISLFCQFYACNLSTF